MHKINIDRFDKYIKLFYFIDSLFVAFHRLFHVGSQLCSFYYSFPFFFPPRSVQMRIHWLPFRKTFSLIFKHRQDLWWISELHWMRRGKKNRTHYILSFQFKTNINQFSIWQIILCDAIWDFVHSLLLSTFMKYIELLSMPFWNHFFSFLLAFFILFRCWTMNR